MREAEAQTVHSPRADYTVEPTWQTGGFMAQQLEVARKRAHARARRNERPLQPGDAAAGSGSLPAEGSDEAEEEELPSQQPPHGLTKEMCEPTALPEVRASIEAELQAQLQLPLDAELREHLGQTLQTELTAALAADEGFASMVQMSAVPALKARVAETLSIPTLQSELEAELQQLIQTQVHGILVDEMSKVLAAEDTRLRRHAHGAEDSVLHNEIEIEGFWAALVRDCKRQLKSELEAEPLRARIRACLENVALQ
ncbi:hypothetical protein AB1Y20_016285 [Prymnesium parvum]|uniref:Uncharacterized protein n=1 Tax=Prymnesium parvum TaxID=97485 RepID=A0AB34IEU1_PRYPA